ESAHSAESYVDYETPRRHALVRGQKLLGGSEDLHRKTGRPQKPAERSKEGKVVIDDGDTRADAVRLLDGDRKSLATHVRRTICISLEGRHRALVVSPYDRVASDPVARLTLAAMWRRSAIERACIFCITRPRWILIVFSAVPSCAAICRFSKPLTTSSST